MRRQILWLILVVSFVLGGSLPAEEKRTVAKVDVTESKWHDFSKQSFKVEESPCFVVVPAMAAPGKPWVWRTSFPDFHAEVDIELVKQGFHIGHIDVVGMLGADPALDLMDKFYELVRQQWGLAEKPALEGVSRGGLHSYRYAARHPARIACLYADTPVMDLKSWPMKRADAKQALLEGLKYYGLKSADELIAFKGNPIDLLEPIAKAKIPLRHVISLNDKVVPPEENTLEAARRLKALGWEMEIVSVPEGNNLEGHHFPLPEIPESVAFFVKYASSQK